MRYEKEKVSKLTIRSDFPTSVSSRVHGANLNAIGFNMAFIAKRRPQLAVELMRLCREAGDLSAETPVAPDEDYLGAMAEMRRAFERR
ncbi:MAG: hypothetical protein ACRDRL_28500 [Sciscionella sp.]